MLTNLYFSFSLIGLSETWIRVDKELVVNINIPGYDFVSQPTLSNAGGVEFYIKHGLNYTIRAV